MLIEKNIVFKAPAKRVWDEVMDTQGVAACFPGVEQIEMVRDNVYRSVVTSKVSYITTIFDLTTTVNILDSGRSLETLTEGKERSGAGVMSQKQLLELKEVSPSETEAVYRAEVSIAGRIATFGQKVIKAKADQLAEEFTEAFRQRVEN